LLLFYLAPYGYAVQAEHGGPGQADGQGQQGQQAGQAHCQQAVQAGQVNRSRQVRQTGQVQLGQRQLYLDTRKFGLLHFMSQLFHFYLRQKYL
jgi:hypothetical protein